jgi:hypothetical protein
MTPWAVAGQTMTVAATRKNHGLAVVNESCFLFLFADIVKKHV